MSILEKILKELYVEPELLAELDEEQKQLLFCKMRQEQVRRWLSYEQQLASATNGQPETKAKSASRVQWLLDDNGEPWVWVMGEETDGMKTVDEAIRSHLNRVQIHHNGLDSLRCTTSNNDHQPPVDDDDWHMATIDGPSADRSKGVAKIPVSEQVLLDVERQIRLMARKAREQHRLNSLAAGDLSRPKTNNSNGIAADGPPTKAAIRSWYRKTEFPKCAGVQGGNFAAWFHGQLSRPEAEHLLAVRDSGAFLVRLSEKICGYVLSYQAGYKTKHFMILSADSGYHFIGSNRTVHPTLNSLVEHHSTQPITETGMELLREPVGQCKAQPDYSEFLDLLR